METENLKTKLSWKKKQQEEEEERKKATAAAKLKKDKVEESLQENKRTLPKEVSEVEIRDCDQNTVKEKKHDNCFSKQSKMFSGNVIMNYL